MLHTSFPLLKENFMKQQSLSRLHYYLLPPLFHCLENQKQKNQLDQKKSLGLLRQRLCSRGILIHPLDMCCPLHQECCLQVSSSKRNLDIVWICVRQQKNPTSLWLVFCCQLTLLLPKVKNRNFPTDFLGHSHATINSLLRSK